MGFDSMVVIVFQLISAGAVYGGIKTNLHNLDKRISRLEARDDKLFDQTIFAHKRSS